MASGSTTFLLALVAVCGLAACESEGSDELETSPAPSLEHLSARVETHFEEVDLIKPAAVGGGEFDTYLAPMFYREPAPGSLASEAGFGALVREGEGWRVDTARPTVYFERGAVSHGGIDLEQLSLRWYSPGPGGVPAVQGLRMTFDSEGFPAIFEVLTDASGASIFYVSKPLETLALEELGEPLRGQRLSVEPDAQERLDVVVPRVLGQGPAPLGPFVYLGAEGTDVLSLHCRCSPSQITDIRGAVEYELAPHDPAAADLGGFQDPDWAFLSLRLPAQL